MEMHEKETKIQTGSVAQCMRKAKGRFLTPKPARNHVSIAITWNARTPRQPRTNVRGS
jgi:hypothetical protein